MSMKAREQKRLNKELDDIRSQSEESSINADTVGDDLTHWKGHLDGPPGTPYEGGHFVIDITIPADYPYTPPKMKFDTKIWHPNISSQTGAICLDVLGKEWSPALTIRTALLSIQETSHGVSDLTSFWWQLKVRQWKSPPFPFQALLSCAEPDDPQDAEVANMYKSDRALFNQTAKYWTATFACVEAQAPHEEKIKNVCDMGFPREQPTGGLNEPAERSWCPATACPIAVVLFHSTIAGMPGFGLATGYEGYLELSMFSYFFGPAQEGKRPSATAASGQEEGRRPGLDALSSGSEKISPSFHPEDTRPIEEGGDASPVSRSGAAAPAAPPSHQSTYDDLSSLSTIMSRDLRLADDASSDAAAATVLQKLEKQNKWRFRATGCRLNILLVGKPGVGKSTLRERMMRSWVEVGSRQSSLGPQRIYQVTDKPAAISFQVTITESMDVSPQLVESLEMELLAYRSRRRRARHSPQRHQRPPCVGGWQRGQSLPDDRIHVCLFLVRAAPVGSMDLPVDVMQGVGRLTNLVPIITKVDQVSRFELSVIRASVRQSLLAAKVAVFEDWYGVRSYTATSADRDNGGSSVATGVTPDEVQGGAVGTSTTSRGTSENGWSVTRESEEGDGDCSPIPTLASSGCPTPLAGNPLLAREGETDGALYCGEQAAVHESSSSPVDVPPHRPPQSSRAAGSEATCSRMSLLPRPDLSVEGEGAAEGDGHELDDFNTYIRPPRADTLPMGAGDAVTEGNDERSLRESADQLAGMTPSSSHATVTESATVGLLAQVLQCPLVLDQASSHEEQDSRYTMPRFDGHPSTSAEFLRMVIIESCSLLLIDRARLLSNKFYLRMERRRHERRLSSQFNQAVMSGVVVASAAAMLLLSSNKSAHASGS
ncbi:ubiquitin-conjugating enzyme E2 K [Perkinsus olseni]|uniref:Ubiquitin-conjugating enzyme E2 K n=1 Tax=Perkinsus olseni TaxID=32597 RepID=A0A7J6L452_PEROL|nr:ubiquitin-conjugating enzyme E2 K [Perkinsus olseni]